MTSKAHRIYLRRVPLSQSGYSMQVEHNFKATNYRQNKAGANQLANKLRNLIKQLENDNE